MSPRKTVILLFLSLFFIALSALETVACTCAGPRHVRNFQPCGVFWSADVVFIGTAEKVSVEKDGRMIVRFAVEKAVRGVESTTVEVETAASTAACGYPFEQGEKYFAYLRRGKDGKLHEGLCGATVLLKGAAVDLEYLRAVESGDTGGKIHGNVFQTVRKSYQDQGEYLPVAGTKIILNSVKVKYAENRESPKYKKIELQTRTDDKGFYIFRDVPAGSYQVRAEFQNNLRELYTSGDASGHYVAIDADKRRCNGYNFNATAQGSLEGEVVMSDGRKPPQQYISLIPLDENGKPYGGYSSLFTWINAESGRFLFNVVPPGKYLLAVNPRNCPSREHSAFGKSFFPGTGGESAAEIISVAENEQKKISNFRLLPALKERVFSGVVLAENKTPLGGAKVSLLASDGCEGFGELVGVKTDEFGRFQLKGYETYEYKIRAHIEKPARLLSELVKLPSKGNSENLELTVSSKY